MPTIPNTWISEIVPVLRARYVGSVEVIKDIVYVHFDNTLDYTLSVMPHDKAKFTICALAHLNPDSMFKSHEVFPSSTFAWKDASALLNNFHSCYVKLKKEEDNFYSDCRRSLTTVGMKESDHDRLYGVPKLMVNNY